MQYATDFNLALELRINKIEGEELILSVDGDCQVFSQMLLRCSYICPKKKGASGSRDGWYPGLITTNASSQNKFEEEGATGSSSSEADAMLSRLSKSTGMVFRIPCPKNP